MNTEKNNIKKKEKILIGRNEWCRLPELNIPIIKAKIDTGARTSAIHAVNISTKVKKSVKYACFDVNPIQGNEEFFIRCQAPVIDERYITSSNGHKEHRLVIVTQLGIGKHIWKIELTLSNRDPLRYRMLLGREAINNRVLINPGISCHQGKVTKQELYQNYELDPDLFTSR